jgi:hypothetical protein
MDQARERANQQAAQRIANSISDPQIAVALLMEQGASREQALQTLACDPHTTVRLSEQIATYRTRIEQEAHAELDAEFAASPEGRQAAARSALRAQEERAQDIAGARALLATNPEEYGMSRNEDLSGYTDDEVLRMTGLVQAERVDESWEATARQAGITRRESVLPPSAAQTYRDEQTARNRTAGHDPFSSNQEGESE